MTTQELKQYIDKVLGNSIRCLLPSYWWKRLFNQVADRVDEVEQSALEVAEASKMPIVASEKELNKLDLPKGSIAAVGISERSFSECYLPEITENFNISSLTKIEEIVVKGGSAPTRDMGLFILVDVDITENIIIDAGIDADNTYAITATYRTVDGNLIDSFILELNGKPYSAGLGYFNALLKEKSFYYGGYEGSPLPADVLAFVDAHLAWKSEGSDLYIKGASWEKLSKEYVVSSEEELNALSVENGTIAKVAREEEKFVGVGTLLQYEDGIDYNSLFTVKKVSISVPKTSIGELSLVYLSTKEKNITLTIVCSADGKDGYIQAWYEDGRKVDLMREQTLVQSNIDDLNSYLSKNVVRYISAGASSGSQFEFIDTWFKVAAPYTVANAYIKGETWTRLLKEGDATGLEVRELYIIGDDVITGNVSEEYTAEQLAYNKETVDLYKQGKVSLVMNATIKTLNLDISCTPLNYINTNNGTVICYEVNAVIARAMILVTVDNTGNAQLVSDDINSGSITIDSELSDTSENPVQNKAIKAYVDEKVANVGGSEIREFYTGDSLTEEQKAWNLETAQAILDKKAIVICNGSILGDGITTNNDGSKEFINSAPTPQGVLYAGVKVEEDGTASVFFRQLYLDDKLSDKSISAVQNRVITAALGNKVDKVDGKQLSTEDFTTALKTKLEGLNNYDDTSIQNSVNSLTTQINTLVSGDASVAIESFNEIIAFLNGVEDSESLDSIIASIEQQIANKQDILVSGTNIKTINGESILGEGNIVVNVDTSNLATKEELNAKQDIISDLATIRSGAALGATAIQEHQDISHLATKEEVTNLQNEVITNEEIIAAAFNDVNERINAISENVSGTTVTKEELGSTVETIKNIIVENEEITATAINDLNTRLAALEAAIINL